MRTEFCKVSGL